VFAAAPAFPPVQGPYTGDYIYITEPGKYTLEQSLTHQYQAGIIIAAPSVVLDGQGYSIQPSQQGRDSSVGIWISLTDGSGNPVTGVSIRNLSIVGEGCGIYAEGADSSAYPWGSDQSASPALSSVRTLSLSDVTISSCHEGIVLNGQSGVRIADGTVSGSSKSGITINDGQAQIIRCIVTGSGESGIHLVGGSGYEITSSTIQDNVWSGVWIERVSDVTITDSILDNEVNLKPGPGTGTITLATPLREMTSIIGGRFSGGNYWASGGISLPAAAGISDQDGDGIGDSPYEPVPGFSDPFPLLKPGDGNQAGILTVDPKVQPTPPLHASPTPVQTPSVIMSGIHAAIIGDTIPSEMSGGTSYPVTLLLANDGSDDWIEQHQIGIMALDETAKYGPAWMGVPVSGRVESGIVREVAFTLRAPVSPGSYTLRYQAARSGSGVEVIYGRPYTKTVTVE